MSYLEDKAWEATMGYPRGWGYPIDARVEAPQSEMYPTEDLNFNNNVADYKGLFGQRGFSQAYLDQDNHRVLGNDVHGIDRYGERYPMMYYGAPADQYTNYIGRYGMDSQQRAANYRAEYENRLEQERAINDYLNYRGAY